MPGRVAASAIQSLTAGRKSNASQSRSRARTARFGYKATTNNLTGNSTTTGDKSTSTLQDAYWIGCLDYGEGLSAAS